jgi:hypothetical protein
MAHEHRGSRDEAAGRSAKSLFPYKTGFLVDAANVLDEAVQEQAVLMAGEAALSGGEARDAVPKRFRGKWGAVLAGVVALFVGLASYDLISSWGDLGGKPVAAGAAAHTHSATAQSGATPRTSASATGVPGTSSAPLSPSPSASPSDSPAPPARGLDAVSAAAFGPNGTEDGDNPQSASHVIDGDAGTAWHTSWYKTAEFGNLKSGTGLVLDMGRTVAVTSVTVTLGGSAGADLELRVGSMAESDALSTVATASDVGGTVRLRPTSTVRGRYVLIWFARLPQDPQGTYQAFIDDITVSGQIS